MGTKGVSDHQQVGNLAAAASHLFYFVKDYKFMINKQFVDRLDSFVAKDETLEWGHFRGEEFEINYTPLVSLGTNPPHIPLTTLNQTPELNRVFLERIEVLQTSIDAPRERGMAFFLLGAYQQFYFDRNKRTTRFMMNGTLMSHVIDAISVPATRTEEFNQKMVQFYLSRDATCMMNFLIDGQLEKDPNKK